METPPFLNTNQIWNVCVYSKVVTKLRIPLVITNMTLNSLKINGILTLKRVYQHISFENIQNNIFHKNWGNLIIWPIFLSRLTSLFVNFVKKRREKGLYSKTNMTWCLELSRNCAEWKHSLTLVTNLQNVWLLDYLNFRIIRTKWWKINRRAWSCCPKVAYLKPWLLCNSTVFCYTLSHCV